jgi:hypothetical protein
VAVEDFSYRGRSPLPRKSLSNRKAMGAFLDDEYAPGDLDDDVDDMPLDAEATTPKKKKKDE